MPSSVFHEIARNTGLSTGDVVRIISSGPLRYKVYVIPKRNGVGQRTIAHPARELKLIQRYIVEAYLSRAPVIKSAYGYVKGLSIRDNARLHSKSSIILKLDFKDFFHCITPVDLIPRLQKRFEMNQELVAVHRLALFWSSLALNRLCLSIGAPSSPIISNIVMYEIDEAVREAVGGSGVSYSRYADDVTISGPDVRPVLEAESLFRAIVAKSESPKVAFNDSKRGLYNRGMKRMVTGLKITPEGNVSLGRERKRLISAGIHRVRLGIASEEHLESVRGWLAFANSAEPEFLDRMRRKYGHWVDTILRKAVRRRI